MGRQHSFMDREFGRLDYDPDDTGTFEPDLVFVIMPFSGPDMSGINEVIKDECGRLGLLAVRADDKIGSGIVIREVTDLIERAEFIICDLTHDRPNVYYELGYAHGVGNEAADILLIAREGTSQHFDVSPLRIHYYSSDASLRLVVASALAGMIRATRPTP